MIVPWPTTLSTMIVGLNPALQKRFVLSSTTPLLIPGQVHRAESIQAGIGGKGQDVAVALSCLYQSHSDSILLAQFLGLGLEGDTLVTLLENQVGSSHSCSNAWTVRTQGKLRTCTTIVSQTDATELVEPSGVVLKEEIEALIERWINVENYKYSTIGGLCFMGTLPHGCSSTLYSTLYHELLTHTIPLVQPICCVVDTVVGLGPLIDSMAFHRENVDPIHSLNMMKINRNELFHLIQQWKPQQGIILEDDCLTVQQLKHINEDIHQIFSSSARAIDCIAITHGKSSSYLISFLSGYNQPPMFYEYKIPNLHQLFPQIVKLYPIGAGDSVAAGTVAAWQYLKHATFQHQPLSENIQTYLNRFTDGKHWDDEVIAFAFGLACGSASCLKQQNSILDAADVLKIVNEIQIQRLI